MAELQKLADNIQDPDPSSELRNLTESLGPDERAAFAEARALLEGWDLSTPPAVDEPDTPHFGAGEAATAPPRCSTTSGS